MRTGSSAPEAERERIMEQSQQLPLDDVPVDDTRAGRARPRRVAQERAQAARPHMGGDAEATGQALLHERLHERVRHHHVDGIEEAGSRGRDAVGERVCQRLDGVRVTSWIIAPPSQPTVTSVPSKKRRDGPERNSGKIEAWSLLRSSSSRTTADLREALVESLRDEGFTVDCACDGADALVYLRKGGTPGLILLDLMMPRMSGSSSAWSRRPIPC